VQQRDAEGGAVPATVSDGGTTRTASLTPSAALRTRTACTVIVDSRTTDTAGDALTATSPITTTAGTQPSAARQESAERRQVPARRYEPLLCVVD
jgi:hypothetical protein